MEATAELTLSAVFDKGRGPAIGIADWEDDDTENMEGSAQRRTCEEHNKMFVDIHLRSDER